MDIDVPNDKGLFQLPVDWAEHDGWRCLFCKGDLDYHSEQAHQLYVDTSWRCTDKQHILCNQTYFMVRHSTTRKGLNGDALTIARWIEFDMDGSLAQ